MKFAGMDAREATMKAIQILIILSLVCGLFAACSPRSPANIPVANTALPLGTIMALTHAAALTAPAAVSTSTPSQVETPALPGSYVYEGPTQRCACENCFCVTNIVIVARITIDAQGVVSGALDKYLADIPPLTFFGSKDNLYGSLQLGLDKETKIKEETDEFSGTLSRNLSTLEGSIMTHGTYTNGERFAAKRTFILFRK
jgi:hypothetical protein